MKHAVWRGNKVEVLTKGVKRAVIVTPLEIRLTVSVHELRTVTTAERVKKDSRKF